MTVEPPVRNDYRSLSGHFQSVRRAWKRAAALSGAAVVLTEGLGLFAVLLFLDWLLQPQTAFRFCLWAAALGTICVFVVRHVIRPLFRRIPDEQIALYIEEKQSDLDGVLITAAEYGREHADRDSVQAVLIDAIIHEATSRSEKISLRHLADFSRLRKYGVIAAVSTATFVGLGLLFPNVVGHRMERVLAPWKISAEQDPDPGRRLPLEPVRFDLSRMNSKLQRGGSFDLDVTLSRPAAQEVRLNFRATTGDAVWQSAPMNEVEKLNGFHGTISDISEDLDFYVSSGGDKSETHRISVFDPLVVQLIETTTHPPDYTRLPDQTENPSTGDIAALIGSKVFVRIHTNTPLKEGEVRWSSGETQHLTVDTLTAGGFTFEVQENASYGFHLTDVNGQETSNATPLTVQAIPDLPPALEVKSPISPVLTHPLGEVRFEVIATDDFGLESVTLVYSRLDSSGKATETRVPLAPLTSDGSVPATYRLMLEDAIPPFKSEEAMSYHLEARDTKGQQTVSDIGLIIIGYYETWGTWGAPSQGGSGQQADEGPDLMAMLSLVWTLNGQKSSLAPVDLQSQSRDLARKMVNASGTMRSFVDLAKMPQLAKVAGEIARHANAAHTALESADTQIASNELSAAATLFAGNGILADIILKKKEASQGGGISSSFTPPTVTMLEQALAEELKKTGTQDARSEKDQSESKAAAAAGKTMGDLLKEQDSIVRKARDQAAATSEAAPGADRKMAGELSKQQHEIAMKTKAAANEAKNDPAAATPGSQLGEAAKKAAEAARTMEDAAKDIANGKGTEGAEKAAKAKGQLEEASGMLADTNRDKLEVAISEAEATAVALQEKQKGLRGVSEISAKELETSKTPDQRQQRDFQAQAFRETELRVGMESLSTLIAGLATRAEHVGHAEATRGLTEAQMTIKRGQPEVKMGNAVIELNAGSPGPATVEQKKAEDVLAKLILNLQGSSDSLAASRDAQLRRAARTAADAKAGLDALGKAADGKAADGKAADGKAADSKAADSKAAVGKAADSKAADSKAADSKAADSKAADSKAADGKAADSKAADGKGSTGEATGNQGGGGGARKVSFLINRLINNLDHRDLVPQAQIDRLKDLNLDKAELEKRLVVDPQTLAEVTGLVSDIHSKLEAETTARSEAGSLQASQREECPPNYRQFVNQYFESLSRTSQAPNATLAP